MDLFNNENFNKILNNTSKNIIVSNKIFKFKFVSIKKVINLYDNQQIFNLFKIFKKDNIIGINLNCKKQKEIIHTIENILNFINKDKYVCTYKLNLYFYNLNSQNFFFLEEILEIINKSNIIYNIYISCKHFEKEYFNMFKKYTKFLFLNKNLNNLKYLSHSNKVLNILNKYLIVICNDNTKLYKLAEVTKYNTSIKRKEDLFENYPLVCFTLLSTINKYIYIDLYNKKNIQVINDVLYSFLDKINKKRFYSYFTKFFTFIENNIENVDNEIIIDKDNIEFIKTLILINLLSNKKIFKEENFQDFLNKVEFFPVSKEMLQSLIDILNKYNINLLNNPFIKNIKYRKFK